MKVSSIRPKRKDSPLSKDADLVEAWLEEQPNILDIQKTFKKSFDDLKSILQNFLNPEDEEDAITSEPAVDFDDEIKEEPKSNYSLSTKKDIKKPVEKFDALFDEDEDDMPF